MRLPPASTVELDSLIRSPFGAGEQRQRDFEAEGFGRLEVRRTALLASPSFLLLRSLRSQDQTNRLRLDGQRASVDEEGRRSACVEKNDVVVWLPPFECDETSKPFARVDRVKHEGFEGTRQFDRFDCRVMKDAISRSSSSRQ